MTLSGRISPRLPRSVSAQGPTVGWTIVARFSSRDLDGKEFLYEAEGPLAVAAQHEMDHLAGKVFVDYLSPLKRSLLLKRLDKQRKQAATA